MKVSGWRRIALATCCLLPPFTCHAKADVITYAGSLMDPGSGWRTASVSKGAFSSTGILGKAA